MFKEPHIRASMNVKRIVSFLPSATELLYELGADHMIYGVTHECNYPPEASKKPRMISSTFDSEKLNSSEIDTMTCNLLKEGKDIFKLNEQALLNANPDLIISQTTCEVCAAHTNQVEKAVQILPKKPIIHSMDPHTLTEIISSISDITKIIGYEEKGKKLQKKLQNDIEQVKVTVGHKPKILAIEWIKPFFTAGHWVPEMIQTAGGENIISKPGEHSRKITIHEIMESDPDMIIIMPCGLDLPRTLKEYQKFLEDDKNWKQLRAVKDGNVFLVDADSYFSKPSIRTITGVQILAKIIHPEIFKLMSVPKNAFLQMK